MQWQHTKASELACRYQVSVPILSDIGTLVPQLLSLSFNHLIFIATVVPRYNDHLYNGNFDCRRNFIGNGSFLIKIYYVIMEFTLSDTDGDSRQRNSFLTHYLFIKTTEKNHLINCLSAKDFNLP